MNNFRQKKWILEMELKNKIKNLELRIINIEIMKTSIDLSEEKATKSIKALAERKAVFP